MVSVRLSLSVFACWASYASLSASTLIPLTASNINSTVKGSIVTAGAQYQGYVDPASGWEFFLGVRYAAKPHRWQAPTPPTDTSATLIQANTYGPVCYQNQPNAIWSGVQAATIEGSEDCLFANVWRPVKTTDTSKLPVLFWIHGGGYGSGNGRNDPTFFSQTTGNTNFIFVSIQYRLGAHGFLSSQAVHDDGVVNAGLLDQNQALKWVQQHISAFGGDPTQVTIFGESAGAGSVLQHLLSYGGILGNTLFSSAMLASPYLPSQYEYNGQVPTALYLQLAATLGCTGSDQFACLATVDSQKLAHASDTVSRSAPYGTWGFAPVVDGTFSQERPSQALLAKKTNDARVLIGNNAAEGFVFTPQNITTSVQVTQYAQNFFPSLNSTDIYTMLKTYYPEPLLSGGLYTTQLERAARIYGDLTFDCAGNFVADAFANSWRYKYSVGDSYHGLDLPNYLPSGTETLPATDDVVSVAFNTFLNTFLVGGNPYINGAQHVPLWQSAHEQADINSIDAIVIDLPIVYAPILVPIPITGSPVASLTTGLRLTNAVADRCSFWASIASKISV